MIESGRSAPVRRLHPAHRPHQPAAASNPRNLARRRHLAPGRARFRPLPGLHEGTGGTCPSRPVTTVGPWASAVVNTPPPGAPARQGHRSGSRRHGVLSASGSGLGLLECLNTGGAGDAAAEGSVGTGRQVQRGCRCRSRGSSGAQGPPAKALLSHNPRLRRGPSLAASARRNRGGATPTVHRARVRPVSRSRIE